MRVPNHSNPPAPPNSGRNNPKDYIGLRLVGILSLGISAFSLFIAISIAFDDSSPFYFSVFAGLCGLFTLAFASIGTDISMLLKQSEKQNILIQEQLEVLKSFRKKD